MESILSVWARGTETEWIQIITQASFTVMPYTVRTGMSKYDFGIFPFVPPPPPLCLVGAYYLNPQTHLPYLYIKIYYVTARPL